MINTINATVTSKGEILIPLDIRNYLKLKAGSKVAFVIDQEGKVKLIPLNVPVETLSGRLYCSHTQATTVEEMDVAISQSIAFFNKK